MDDGSCWRQLIVFVVLVVLHAYFSAAESAYVTCNKIRLRSYADDGDKRAARAIYIIDNFDRALTTLLIGNNLVNIGTAVLATVVATELWGEGAVVWATLVTTLLIFLASEMIPKYYAKAHGDKLALAFSSSLFLLMKVLYPVAFLFMGVTKLINRVFKVKNEPTMSEEELSDLIDTVEDEGVIDDDSGELLQSALEFSDTETRHVMVAVEDIVSIDVRTPPDKTLQFLKNEKHSRIPVWEGNPSNVIGVLPARAFLRAYVSGKRPSVRRLMLPALFSDEHEPVDELFARMTRRKVQMAFIRDDGGKLVGLVTVEDIVEELVGEIWDEQDVVSDEFMKLGGNCFSVSGSLLVTDAFARMKYDCDDPDLFGVTVAAWAEKKLGVSGGEDPADDLGSGDEAEGEDAAEEKDDDLEFAYRNIEVYVTDVEDGVIKQVEMRIIASEDIEDSELIAAEPESERAAAGLSVEGRDAR